MKAFVLTVIEMEGGRKELVESGHYAQLNRLAVATADAAFAIAKVNPSFPGNELSYKFKQEFWEDSDPDSPSISDMHRTVMEYFDDEA